MRVKHTGGLTTVKVPEHRDWLERNARTFEEKWGRLPAPIPRFRRARGGDAWHFCQNCSSWPADDFEEAAPANDYGLDNPPVPPGGVQCEECKSLRDSRECAFY